MKKAYPRNEAGSGKLEGGQGKTERPFGSNRKAILKHQSRASVCSSNGCCIARDPD